MGTVRGRNSQRKELKTKEKERKQKGKLDSEVIVKFAVLAWPIVEETEDYSTLKQSEMPDMQCLDQLARPWLTSAPSPPPTLSQSTGGSLTTSPFFPFISAEIRDISSSFKRNYRVRHTRDPSIKTI